jgi:hypothetical protein
MSTGRLVVFFAMDISVFRRYLLDCRRLKIIYTTAPEKRFSPYRATGIL